MLRASVYGRLVCVKGTVVRVSNIRPLCTRMAFRCQSCMQTMSLPLQHGKYATPTKVCIHTLVLSFSIFLYSYISKTYYTKLILYTHIFYYDNLLICVYFFTSFILLSVSSRTVAVAPSPPAAVLLLHTLSTGRSSSEYIKQSPVRNYGQIKSQCERPKHLPL